MIRRIIAIFFICTGLAQAGPVFNGAVPTYDVNVCTNSTATSCTFTAANNYGANAVCFAYDQGANNPVAARCSVSGNVVTITMAPTTVQLTCTMSATTCTATLPYVASTTYYCTTSAFTNNATVIAGEVSISSTTVTITASATNAYIWRTNCTLVVPSATAHVFQAFVIQ